MSDLKPFSGAHSLCPKCTGTAIREYCTGKQTGRGLWAQTLCALGEEHLHRTCAMCGYKWMEKCADESERAASNNR